MDRSCINISSSNEPVLRTRAIAPARFMGNEPHIEIATLLNENGVPTKRGGQWAAMTVQKIARRVEV